ncbi:response regulator [Pendulispora albinea]|uniref:Response regulator n=1 Tax=Pendulispora albinea TaxID=2741071 RepID=A0ABZ2LNI2_9BACT
MEGPRRILVVDDNAAIHEDFRKVLCPLPADPSLGSLESALFGGGGPVPQRDPTLEYVVDYASQGQAGYDMVVRARERGRPYALAFVDMKMPPGWDGVETIKHMIGKDPDLEVVICSAYSDYSWHDVIRRLNRTGLRLLKKPFDSKDVLDLAWSLTSRWLRRARARIA